jgi:hypothetical protein
MNIELEADFEPQGFPMLMISKSGETLIYATERDGDSLQGMLVTHIPKNNVKPYFCKDWREDQFQPYNKAVRISN